MSGLLFSNLYLCLDRETKIVIWARPNWSGYPNLKSSDVNLSFLNYRINRQFDFKSENFENFEIIYSSSVINNFEMKRNFTLLKRSFEISDHQRDIFTLTKIKCNGIYSWIDGMYEYLKKFSGILPDIYISNRLEEENLIKDEYLKVRALISENINQHYESLWSCSHVDDFHNKLAFAMKNTSFY